MLFALAVAGCVYVPSATALFGMKSMRPSTVWQCNGTSVRSDYGVYSFFPPECNGASICCPNDCNSATARGTCVNLLADTAGSVCDFAARDALGWVTTRFQSTCLCKGRFGGTDCSQCTYGWTGPNCDVRATPVVRRDFATLSSSERERVVAAFQQIRTVPSITNPTKLSAWDFVASQHYWATNTTCNTGLGVSYAHTGQGFPTWHRRYVRDLELTLQRVLDDDTFGLPYWNWTSTSALISQVGLASAIATDPVLSSFGGSAISGDCYRFHAIGDTYYGTCAVTTGPFANQPIYDPTESVFGNNWCPFGNLTRAFGLVTNLPNTSHVDFLLQQPVFAVSPYDSKRKNGNSFEQSLEGNYPDPSQAMQDTQSMHDSVHDWVGGAMSWLLTAPNDPLFFLHHCFVDKLFETWIQTYGPQTGLDQMGGSLDAPIGHGKDECQAPFYPLTKHSYWFNHSTEFGYQYDVIPFVAIPPPPQPQIQTQFVASEKTIGEVAAGPATFYGFVGALFVAVPQGVYHLGKWWSARKAMATGQMLRPG